MATKTTAGSSTGTKTKTGFKQDVGFQRDVNKSVAISKSTLNTGGGTPIQKGHKRTTEHRVLQPRDPDTGRFDYNSSANISRKYKYHAEHNGSHKGAGGGGTLKTLPYFARGFEATFAKVGVKKGDVITVNGQKYISTMDMTPEEFREQLENYLEDENGGTHLGNDYNWMKLGGRNDKNTGFAEAGDNRESSLEHFKNAVEKRTEAYDSDKNGRKLLPRFAEKAPDLSGDRLAANQAYNLAYDAAHSASNASTVGQVAPAVNAATPVQTANSGNSGVSTGTFDKFIQAQKNSRSQQPRQGGLAGFFNKGDQKPADQRNRMSNVNKAGLAGFLKTKGF